MKFSKLPGLCPGPRWGGGGGGAYSAPQTPSWRRAVLHTACLASQDLPSSFFSHSSYFGRTSFFFVATALLARHQQAAPAWFLRIQPASVLRWLRFLQHDWRGHPPCYMHSMLLHVDRSEEQWSEAENLYVRHVRVCCSETSVEHRGREGVFCFIRYALKGGSRQFCDVQNVAFFLQVHFTKAHALGKWKKTL